MSDGDIGSLFDTLLVWVTNLVIVCAVLWAGLSVFDYFRRRALNLTEAESVRSGDVKPGFLKVDEEKRKAALEGGTRFDTQIAERDAPPTVAAKACSWAKGMTLLFAGLSLLTGIVGALLRVRFYDEIAKDYGSWDSAVAIVTKYPVGFAIAAIVILISIFTFVRTAQDQS